MWYKIPVSTTGDKMQLLQILLGSVACFITDENAKLQIEISKN